MEPQVVIIATPFKSGSNRRPKRILRDRFCRAIDCPTKLSKYNKREVCFIHHDLEPVAFRNRGVV